MELEKVKTNSLISLFKCVDCNKLIYEKIFLFRLCYSICENCSLKPSNRIFGESSSHLRNYAVEAIFSILAQGNSGSISQNFALSKQDSEMNQKVPVSVNAKPFRRVLLPCPAILPSVKENSFQRVLFPCPAINCKGIFSDLDKLQIHVIATHGHHVTHMDKGHPLTMVIDNKINRTMSGMKMVLYGTTLLIIHVTTKFDGRHYNVKVDALNDDPKFTFTLNGTGFTGHVSSYRIIYGRFPRVEIPIETCKDNKLVVAFHEVFK